MATTGCHYLLSKDTWIKKCRENDIPTCKENPPFYQKKAILPLYLTKNYCFYP